MIDAKRALIVTLMMRVKHHFSEIRLRGVIQKFPAVI